MIDQTITIPNATAAQIYDVLLDSKKHTRLIGDSATIDPTEGGKFAAFGEYATGNNLKLTLNKLIKQTWRADDWPEGHYSTISFALSDTDGGAQIHFTQKDLPKGTQKQFESGWDDFYWQPLRDYFV